MFPLRQVPYTHCSYRAHTVNCFSKSALYFHCKEQKKTVPIKLTLTGFGSGLGATECLNLSEVALRGCLSASSTIKLLVLGLKTYKNNM